MPPKPWYAKGLSFECTQCGNCCRNDGGYSYVYLSAKDVVAIADYLKLPPGRFVAEYCKVEDGWVTLRMDEPDCAFLQEDNRCAIYPVRPKQCATWPFWEDNLDQKTWEGPVAERCPGIGKGKVTPAAEVERIARETEEWYDEDEG